MVERIEADHQVDRSRRQWNGFAERRYKELWLAEGWFTLILHEERIQANPLGSLIGEINQAERAASNVQHPEPAEPGPCRSEIPDFFLLIFAQVQTSIRARASRSAARM